MFINKFTKKQLPSRGEEGSSVLVSLSKVAQLEKVDQPDEEILVIGHHQSFSFFGEGYFDCDKTTGKCVDKSAPDADIDTRYTR